MGPVNGLTAISRDIGASIVPTSSTEDLSIALLAADVIALVESLGWGEVDMMGFSMGGEWSSDLDYLNIEGSSARTGSVLQQILVTPALPFYIGHAILAATTTKAPHSDPVFLQLLMPRPSKSGASLTQQQLKLRALAFARQMTELGYDEEWLSDPMNRAIVEAKIPDMIVGRPAVVIGMLGGRGLSFHLFAHHFFHDPLSAPVVAMELIPSLALLRCTDANHSCMPFFVYWC